MLHMHLPTDPRIVDEIFSLKTQSDMEDVGWLLAMIVTYGKTPLELKGFTWNDDNSINIKSKKIYSPTSSSVGFLVSTQRKAALQPEEPLALF